jgi:hypothetical protein
MILSREKDEEEAWKRSEAAHGRGEPDPLGDGRSRVPVSRRATNGAQNQTRRQQSVETPFASSGYPVRVTGKSC